MKNIVFRSWKVMSLSTWPLMLLTAFLLPLSAAAQGFSDGFEGASIDSAWSLQTVNGSISLSTDVSHTGKQSLKMSSTGGGQRSMNAFLELPTLNYGDVSVWFYDTAPNQQTLYNLLNVDRRPTGPSDPGYNMALGIEDYDPSFYHFGIVFGPNGVGGQSTIMRTMAWHKLEVRVDPTHLEELIDGTQVFNYAGNYPFNEIDLNLFGPGFRPNATYYFDDFNYTPLTSTVPESKMMGFLIGIVFAVGYMVRCRRDRRNSHAACR